ncbi:hypothetical protein ACFFQW_21840 [Umezawaea endophytica]|uniref:Uncharacterized protein n=1 Tax=Umezawaea endophytica TaxID=1654476 RepID=A0A9X3A0X3_9PSEU|nr:hypothetical protein [Umezawaea endophytica]MCS7477388.1 hypothetical protein [Umezawaea endophytica]
MTTSPELAEKLLAALRSVPGLRPAAPPTKPTTSWVPWDWDTLAVDLSPEVVEVRVVATALPLPPRLAEATTVLNDVLRHSPFATATLRIVVTDLDAAALLTETYDTPPAS